MTGAAVSWLSRLMYSSASGVEIRVSAPPVWVSAPPNLQKCGQNKRRARLLLEKMVPSSANILLFFQTCRHMPLELFSKWSEISDVLLLMKHFMVEVVPNLRNSYSPASSVSLQNNNIAAVWHPGLATRTTTATCDCGTCTQLCVTIIIRRR